MIMETREEGVYVPARLRAFFNTIGLAQEAGVMAYRYLNRHKIAAAAERRRKRHCSPDEIVVARPEWDAIACEAAEYVTRYGDQAALARRLGIPRQRVHEYLRSGRGLPGPDLVVKLLDWLEDCRQCTGTDPRPARIFKRLGLARARARQRS